MASCSTLRIAVYNLRARGFDSLFAAFIGLTQSKRAGPQVVAAHDYAEQLSSAGRPCAALSERTLPRECAGVVAVSSAMPCIGESLPFGRVGCSKRVSHACRRRLPARSLIDGIPFPLLVRDLDGNELFFWLPNDTWAALERDATASSEAGS